MSVVDYVKSRVEEGDPAFDLDWETAKEIERMREQDALAESDVVPYEGEVPFSVRRPGEARMSVGKTQSGTKYVLFDRDPRVDGIDWTNPRTVYEFFKRQIGESAKSEADNADIFVGRETAGEYTYSAYARSASQNKREKKVRAKAASQWREIVSASGTPIAEPTKHKNREGGVYYKRHVNLIASGYQTTRAYEADLVTFKENGKEIFYDLVGVKENPSLTEALTVRGGHGSPKGLAANHEGSASSISYSDREAQEGKSEQKFHVGRVNVSELPGEDIIEFKPKVEMMDGTRVADAPENMGERSNYGLTASRELMNAKPTPLSQLGRINPMSLPVSEMLVLWKQMTGNVKGPAVKARLAGGATHGRDGELTIAADVFGIVDRTDMAAEKSRLKDHGFFQNEDPAWAATHTPLENRNEKSRSEEQLGHQLALLGERRVKGLEAGGQAAARGVFAHELAQVVMNMPRQPGVVGRVQKIGDGIRKAVAAQVRSAGTTGKENVEAKMRQEAGDFLDWAYGGPQTDPTSGQPVSRGQSLSMKQLTDATFGAFLTMPAEMKSRAPTWYDAVIDTIATTPKLAEAFRELSLRGVSRQAHGAVVEAVRKSMSRETQKRLAELKADIEEPISTGSLLSDAKETILVGLHDRMAPTVVRIDAKTKAYVKAKRAVIRQMKKQGAPAADIAAVEAEIERFTGNVQRKLNELEISRTAWERGAANEGLVYVDKMRELELEAGERWGLTQEDRSFYLNQMRVIETQGRAGARGESGAQAQAALGDMARRLGAEKWAHLQDYGRRFHAIVEQEVLNDPRVSEMLGEGFVNYMRSQAHYVTTKRVHSVEELDAIEQARADARAKGINGGDDVVKQMFDYADSLGGWDAKLVGSFSDTKEARSATWERHEQLMQATRRNHLVIQMRDALLAAGVEGVRDLPRTEKDVPQGSRYGLLNYVEGGVKKTLVVPRQIADGFKASPKSFATIMRVNEFCRKLMIDWNLGYAPVDASRNLGSIEKHMPGMHETPAKSLTRAVAPGAMGLTQIVAQSLAKRAKPLADGLGMLPGFKNSIYPFVGEAHEIVKYLQNPNDFQRKVWEARDTGDAAEEARLYRIQRTARQVLKANMFVSFAARTTGRATEGFANDFFNRHGMSIEDTPAAATKFEAIRKALMSKRNPFNANKTLIEYNDMFAKTVAYLHDRAVYGFQRSEAESGVTVKQNVGLGEVERRGRSSNTIQATINQFFNAVEKGMTQTARAIRDRPGETLAKCALSWTGRFVAGLAGTGVLAAAIRAMFDDDEEKIQASPLGDVYDYLQACERANRNLSAYTRENYNVTPLWNSPDGYTSVVLALPLDDQDRLFAWAADHAAGQVADKMKLNQVGPKRSLIGDASAATLKSMTPDLTFSTPVFNLLRLLFASANGENPRDNFRGAPMYDTNTWEMRGESLENDAQYLLETGKILWNQTGGRSFYNFGYNGVDPKAGEGDAPEWLGLAVNKIPIVSPVLKRFVKIQVGSAEKDALPVKEELKRIQATVTYCQRKLMQESASLDGALNERDPKRYAELLSKWKETYGLSDAAMRKIEVNFLNAWRDLENKDVKERKRTINVIKRGHKMGVEKADEFLRSGQL